MKRTKLFMIICIIGIFLFVIGHFTYAWVGDNGMTSPIGLTASLHKSYFESGDGGSEYTLDGSGNIVQSETGPFEIKYPIQFYYLAWLQALGYFESDENEDGTIDQYYFYVSDDLDMSEFVLPPVGTKDNPFLGHFDGQGHMIYNVNIVSDKASTTDSPETTFSQTEIVGLFGVIGTLGDTPNSYTTKSGTTYTYDSSVNEVKDLYISNVNINTKSSNTLIGIAAGYVNGTVSKVGVINSSITFTSSHSALDYTSNLSDYALIGYCTDEFKDNVHAERVELGKITVDNSEYTEGDDGDSAGGSIPMESIFNRIKKMYNNKSEVENYAYEREIGIDQNGNQFYTRDIATKTVYKYNAGNNGHVLFADTSDTIMYLGGGTKVFEYHYNTETKSGFYINDGSGNYLRIVDGEIENTTQKNNASVWAMSGANSGTLHTCDQYGKQHYLIVNGGVLTTSNSSSGATNWTKTNNQLYTSSGTRYYVYCDNGSWGASSSTSITRYRMSSNYTDNRYIINNNTSLTTTTSTADSTYIWRYDGSSTRQIYTYINGIKYYLYTTAARTPVPGLQTTEFSWNYSSNKLYYDDGNYFYYFYVNNTSIRGSRVSRRTSSVYYKIDFTGKSFTIDLNVGYEDGTFTDCTYVSGEEYMDYSTITNDTYIPLKANETTYATESANSGYITVGMKSANFGDLRVSRYSSDSIAHNKNSPLTITFRTYNNSTPTSAASKSNSANLGLQKFNDSYSTYTSLVGNTYVYGLHFMSALISKDEYVTIPQATLKGDTKYNFQVPANSIDFLLAQRGFINFYAGTYYNGSTYGRNTAFFSLHKIFRDDDDNIIDVKEISKVYGIIKNNQIDITEEYIYLYSDGSYSKTLPANYQMIFDMDWITTKTKTYNFTNDSAYYFEVPVNEGEFALGSVDGRTGAYLIYLDLQSNKQKIERTEVRETWQEIKVEDEIPNGVAIVESKGDIINETKSATIKMPTGTSGTTTISRTGNAVTYTDSTGAEAAFIGDGITANGETDGGGKTTILTERLTYYDYNTTTKVTKIIVTTTVITTNPDGTTSRTSTQTIDGTANSEYVDDNHAVTLGNTVAKWYYYDRSDATVSTEFGFDYKTSPSTYTITITTDKEIKVKHQLVDSSYSVSINGTALTATEAEKTITAN